MKIRQRASVSFSAEASDFDPALVTELLGITPTEAYRRGELRGPSGRAAKSSAWILRGGYTDDYDSEATVVELLDVLDPLREQVLDAQRRWGLALGVSLVVHMYGETTLDAEGRPDLNLTTPGLGFEASTIARLAGLGAWLDIDQYAYGSDDDGMASDSPLIQTP